MDIKLVHNEQLKITLFKTDMEELEVDYKSLDYKNPRVRSVLLSLFSGAVRQTGFKINGGKLLIEAFPSKHGGCILYFTRLSDGKKRYRKASFKKSFCVYKFSTSADMQDALERISIASCQIIAGKKSCETCYSRCIDCSHTDNVQSNRSIYDTPLLEMYFMNGFFYLTADNPSPYLKTLLREYSYSENEVNSDLFLKEYAKFIQSV